MAPETLTLQSVLHTHSDELWDVAALVRCAASRFEALDADDETLRRLFNMIGAKIGALQEILDPHI